ncbi:MAG: FAA hydrolase family protein [Pseudonocardiales bacterium]|nr:MAG: FAA hydrolase family protein [Pseudonocardiales bacterium]
MRFAKHRPDPSTAEIVVDHDGGWYRLVSLPGFEQVSRLAEVVTVPAVEAIASTLPRAAAGLEPVLVDLAASPTVADREPGIWGAGLNYRGHSKDLDAEQPRSGPGSYLRPPNCLIGNSDTIDLPTQSLRVTAEAELGLVIATSCKNVDRSDWRSVVAGVTTVLDMTAEDVIRENSRYIPWAKGFDTFCSIGPALVTMDEFTDAELCGLTIATVRNGETVAAGTPAQMKYDIGYLIEYFTAGRTLEPGTVICTGTPGAAVIEDGDVVSAVVENVGTLSHPVRRQAIALVPGLVA